jgi:hypothetical protein
MRMLRNAFVAGSLDHPVIIVTEQPAAPSRYVVSWDAFTFRPAKLKKRSGK